MRPASGRSRPEKRMASRPTRRPVSGASVFKAAFRRADPARLWSVGVRVDNSVTWWMMRSWSCAPPWPDLAGLITCGSGAGTDRCMVPGPDLKVR